MTDKNIIKKLAVERCQLHVSHICALHHLSEERERDDEVDAQYLYGLFESLNRDLALIDRLIAE